MPAKKIDPEEQKHLDKRDSVKKKLMFAVGFAALVVLTNVLMTRTSEKEVVNAERKYEIHEEISTVLGEATDEEKERLERVQTQAIQLKETVTEESNKLIDEGKEQVEQKVSDLIYATTIKPLVDRINSLSEGQQEAIREAVCKPVEPEEVEE